MSQLSDTIEPSDAMDPIEVYEKGFAAQLHTETIDTIQVTDECGVQEIEEIVEVKDGDVNKVVNTDAHPASIYIIPLEDGRLYLGTTKNFKHEIELLCFKPAEGVSPIILPKKSKLDMAKYWYILSEKYGEQNIVTNEPGVQEYYKKAFEDREYIKQHSESSYKKFKKTVFKFKTEEKSKILTTVKSLASSCRKLIGKLSFFGAIKS